MSLISGLRRLGASLKPDTNPDQQFGTGLWRHNRDRFARAVDRYYTTALAVHAAAPTTPAVESIVKGTHRLNELSARMDTITAQLQAAHPVPGQVVPAEVRARIGRTPELLTRASAKVSEAVQAASMARASMLAHRPIDSTAEVCHRFIDDAARLLEAVEKEIGHDTD